MRGGSRREEERQAAGGARGEGQESEKEPKARRVEGRKIAAGRRCRPGILSISVSTEPGRVELCSAWLRPLTASTAPPVSVELSLGNLAAQIHAHSGARGNALRTAEPPVNLAVHSTRRLCPGGANWATRAARLAGPAWRGADGHHPRHPGLP